MNKFYYALCRRMNFGLSRLKNSAKVALSSTYAIRFFALQLSIMLALCINGCLSDSSTGGADSIALEITITSPRNSPTIDTTDPTLSLAGNVTSGANILHVIWSNDRGGNGIATGTASWKISSVALELGLNRITVVAEDSNGARASRQVTVFRESGQSGTATLFWNAPTTRTDGSPLTNLAGYKIRFGRMSGIYDYQIDVDNPGVVVYVVENLVPGDWFFVLSAYDSDGLESERSNEVIRSIT